jgi:penicillin-binding protein 1A
VLIGMLKGNTLYNPRKNPKASIERRNIVLNQMVKNNYLPETEAAAMKLKPIDMSHYRKLDENNGLAPYFRDVLRDELKRWCKENKNAATGEPYNLYEDGLRIYTTISPRMQLYADEAVAKQMPILQKALSAQYDVRKGVVWKEHQNVLEAAMHNSDRWRNLEDEGLTDAEIKKSFYQPVAMKVFAWNSRREKDTVMTPMDSIKYNQTMLQTGFMVMDPITGAVKAWVGGIDFKTYKFDHVNINTKRQVGSSIKPFLYSLAIEDFNFTPETECEATQQYFPKYRGFVPAKNSGRTGTRTMATGLAWSINEVAAYIMKSFGDDGPQRFSDFIKEINIPTKVTPYPSLALGACELSLYEMLWGYTMFPSGGFSTKPYYISRIEDKNGKVLARFDTDRKEVLSQATAYTMVRMMQGPVDFGTAAGLRDRLGISEMGGKTGTTNDNSDAWFMGYTPQLMAGAWIGCDDRFIHLEGGLGYGAQAARPIWEYFFAKVMADKTLGISQNAKFIQPENMRQDRMFDYQNLIDKTAPPGAEGANEGNGKANQYLDTSAPTVPLDSKLSPDEQKVLKEASIQRNDKQGSVRITVTDADKKQEPPKKKGFFKRLFGSKDH